MAALNTRNIREITKQILNSANRAESDSFDSINYRLALRISRLIANKFGERQNVFKEIRTLYNTTSKIIHGDAKSRQKHLEKINISKIESYLRTALKLYITILSKKTLKHQQLMDILDFGSGLQR